MAALTLKQALAQFWLQITGKFVSKESGKGLSTNDYSDADKQKLESIPDTVGTITGVTAGNGLSGGGTSGAITIAAQVDRGLSIVSDKIGHSNSVTAGTASEGGSTRTLAFGGIFNVPSVTYDAQGHISGKSSIKLTMPATPSASDVGAIAITAKGVANGVAELDANGRVPSSQLPSYVDDILEFSSIDDFPTTGETGKIYLDLNTDLAWRWSGSAYVEISPSLALGDTSSTAFAGDKGLAAYTHAVTNKGIAKSSGLYKITTNSEGHVTAATAVVKEDITGLDIPAQDTTYSAGTGISINNTTITNSGVRSISSGSTDGTISVNTNGTTTNVAVAGLGSAAYTNASNYAQASSLNNYLPLAGGALSGRTYSSVTVNADDSSFRNIRIISPNVEVIAGETEIPTGEIWLRYEE